VLIRSNIPPDDPAKYALIAVASTPGTGT